MVYHTKGLRDHCITTTGIEGQYEICFISRVDERFEAFDSFNEISIADNLDIESQKVTIEEGISVA